MSQGAGIGMLCTNPKLAKLDFEAIGFWAICLSMAINYNRSVFIELSRGYISDGFLESMGFKNAKPIIKRLVAAGLWENDSPFFGYKIVDFEKYKHNPRVLGVVQKKKLREKILNRDGHKCAHCGATERLTIDHLMPVCRGGTNDESNLGVACARCNTSKGFKTIEEWQESKAEKEKRKQAAIAKTEQRAELKKLRANWLQWAVGKPESDVIRSVELSGLAYRVVMRDDTQLTGMRPCGSRDRVNLKIDKGLITEAYYG